MRVRLSKSDCVGGWCFSAGTIELRVFGVPVGITDHLFTILLKETRYKIGKHSKTETSLGARANWLLTLV